MTTKPDQITTMGIAYSRYGNRPFGIRQADRMQHISILGQTGTGKSTLMLQMMKQDIKNGQGLCLIDPHGDLAKQVSEFAPEGAIIWNAADPSCSYGYNPLTRVSAPFRPILVSGLIETLKKQWMDAWGARMEHILRYTLFALLDQPHADLRDIMRLFLERDYRREVVDNIEDDQIRQFWVQEFPSMNYKTAFDGVAPIANKLGAFLAHPVLRKSLCEPEKPLRFRKIMDDGQILIVNLSKGQLGSDMANVIGGLILSGFANAAFSRYSQPLEQRRPYFLYADEFHAFTTSTIADMVSELRKYGLSLTLANQYLSQIEPDTLDALLGNVGTTIIFRASPDDAERIALHTAPILPRDLTSLPNYQMFLRLMVEGARSKPFTAWGAQT